jgi:RNA polymerase sigma-70 factor, ECF subfamily
VVGPVLGSGRTSVPPARVPVSGEPECTGAQPARTVAADRDRPLLAAVAAGDEAGLRGLVDRHGSGLLAYLTGLVGDPRLAEEVLQDTLLAVWRGAAGFVGGSTVRTWMFAVGRRRAVDALRRRGTRPAGADEAELAELADSRPGPEGELLARADLDRVAAAIARLTAAHREVLLLACVHELTGGEISAVLGVPVGTVKSRLSLARVALGRLLSEEDGERDG